MNDSEKLSYYNDSFGEESVSVIEKNLFDDDEALRIFLAPILEIDSKISALAKANQTVKANQSVDLQAQENLSQVLDYIKSYVGYLRPRHYEVSEYFKNFVHKVFVISPILKQKHDHFLERITFLETHSADQI